MTRAQNPSNSFYNACPKEVTFSSSQRGLSKHYMKSTLSRAEFFERVTNHEIGDKEGSAWSPFDFVDDIREAANCIGASVIVLDIDNGTPLRHILLALGLEGYAAAVVSSYSQGSTRTRFSKREFDRWREANPDAGDEEFLRTRAKGFHSSVWRRSTIACDEDGEPRVDGRGNITVEHAPCSKFRLIVPLAKTFLVADYGNQGEAARTWKDTGHALADELRITPDASAFDLARLFFDPRHPADVEPVVRFVPGEPFDAERALARARGAGAGKCRDDGKARRGACAARQSAAAVEVFNGDIDLLREAVMAIKNDKRFDERNEWLKLLAALHHETDDSDEGLDLALEWSAKWKTGGNDPRETERVWNSFRVDRVKGATGATIRAYARRDGWRGPEGFVYGDGEVEPTIVFPDEREITQLDSRHRGLRFHFSDELHRLHEASYLVKRWWFEGQLSSIYGQPGGSKTFLALDMSLHIALGRSWFGCEVKRGVVIYIALEGISGIRKRAEAACKHHGVKLASVPILFADGMMDLANDKGLPSQIACEAEKAAKRFGWPVRVIIIDTLARAMNGGDENSSRDMGALIAGADKLRMATGAHVCLVHHEGKDRDKGMRGSSALLGAVDTAIAVGRDKQNYRGFEAKLTKQKEDEACPPLRYTLDRVTLDRCGEDGEPIASAVVTPAISIVFGDERLTPRERDAMAVLRNLAEGLSGTFNDEEESSLAGIEIRNWKSALAKSGWPPELQKRPRTKGGQHFARATNEPGQGADKRRTAETFDREFRRLRKSLETKGFIETDGDFVSFARGGGGQRADKIRTTRQGGADKRTAP